MESRIGVAVIGVGILGSRHARVYQEQADAALVAVVDANREKGTAAATKFNAKYFAQTKEMVQALGPKGSGELHAVSIATPDHAHFEVVRDCLEGGLDVFVEKPLTMDPAEARSLIALAKERGRVLNVNYSQRWLPEHRHVEDMVRSGAFGRLAFIESHRWDAAWVPQRMITWGPSTTPIYFMSSHDIDLISFWLDDTVESVQAMSHKGILSTHMKNDAIVDGVVALLRFSRGTVVSLHSSWILPEAFPLAADTYLEVIGSDATVFLGGSTREMRVFRQASSEKVVYSGPATATEVQGKLEGAFTQSLRTFLGAVQTRDVNGPTSAARTLHVVEIQDAITRSAQSQTTVTLKGGK
jgi:predicted dehydrogenase